MKKILFLSLFLILSVFIYSCSDSGGDDGSGVPSGGGTGGEVVNPDPGGQIPDDGSQGGTYNDTPSQTGFPTTGDPSCPDDSATCGGMTYKCYDYAVWPTGMDDVIVRPDNHSGSNLLAIWSGDNAGSKFNNIFFKNFTYNEYKAYVRKFVDLGYTLPSENMYYASIDEALSDSEPPMGTHFVELLKDSTFNNNTIGGYKMRYSVRIEWFSDYEIGDRCGVGRHKLVLNQNAVFVE